MKIADREWTPAQQLAPNSRTAVFTRSDEGYIEAEETAQADKKQNGSSTKDTKVKTSREYRSQVTAKERRDVCDALTATLFIFVSFEYFVVPHELCGPTILLNVPRSDLVGQFVR